MLSLRSLHLLAVLLVFESVTAFQVDIPTRHRLSATIISRQSDDGAWTTTTSTTSSCWPCLARRRRRNDDDDSFYGEDNYDEGYEEYDDDDEADYFYRRRDDLGNFRERRGLDVPSSFGRRDGWRLPESVSKSLLAGVFVLGVGLGVTVDSQVNTNPKDLASRDAIDNAAPNPTLCAKLGASAMAFDERVFVTFNPFNIYVSQADVKPACVLREANVVPVLKQQGLITDAEVRSCKQNMNTWAYVGSLEDTPQLSCVYKSQDAQNEFLSNPKIGIGEDYLDDDREKSTGKIVKGAMTEAQKDTIRKAASLP
jgi:hypothetical protein